MLRKLIPLILVLSLSVTSCNLHISLPLSLTPGPTVIDEINIPAPEDETQIVNLSMKFGAGKLTLTPGADTLVSGTAMYNISAFKPEVTIDDKDISIEQGEWRFEGIPSFSDIKNNWDLLLGDTTLNLSIEAGAYKAEYELGGLALSNLTLRDGAADVQMNFSSPNQIEMGTFRYETGASNVSLRGLANANFSMLEFDGGAGNFSLDFSGTLQRNAGVDIETGMSNMTLVIPENIPAQITVEGGLANVSYGSGWTRSGNLYTQEGSGPRLTMIVEIGAGNLTLTR